MFDKFVPDIYAKSIFLINYKKLRKSGIKCLLFDLNNTIAPNSVKTPSKKTIDLFEELKDYGFKIILMSNTPKYRVEPFKNKLNVDAAAFCLKPKKEKYLKIMKIYNFKPEEICAIGDQLLTDVYGANRLDITSLLVNPISPKDNFTTFINRYVERYIMKKLHKKDLFTKGEYYE